MAATRIGPPTPPPGRPRSDDQAAPAGAPCGPVVAPTFPPDARALRALAAMADVDGLIAVDLRRLAAELDLTTVATRALLAALVDAGALSEVGRRVYALDGSWTTDETPPPGPRTPPHDAVHEGTGSPLLW